MKKEFFLLVFSITILSGSIDIAKLSKKIDDIDAMSRLSLRMDYDIYDPFAKAKPLINRSSKKRIVYSKAIKIQTILNDRVLINNKWFSVGDKVFNAKIKNIRKKSITILKNRKLIRLHLRRIKDIIKTEELIK